MRFLNTYKYYVFIIIDSSFCEIEVHYLKALIQDKRKKDNKEIVLKESAKMVSEIDDKTVVKNKGIDSNFTLNQLLNGL